MAVQTSYSKQLTVAIEGQLADDGPHDIISMVNHDTLSAPFGCAVCFEGSTTDEGALQVTNTSNTVAGVVVWSNNYSQYELEAGVGVKTNNKLSVLRRGRIWVKVEETVAPGDRMYIRADIGEASERHGTFRKSADESDCIASTGQGVFLTSATAGNLAVLEVNFTDLPA